MIYLIYSKESEMARRSALKILKKEFPKRDEGNYVCFNMAVTPIKTLVDECEAMSLMSSKKAVLAEDCAFLSKVERISKKIKDAGSEALEQYCLHPNPDVDLFLVVYAEHVDTKNKVVDAISKTGMIKEVPVPPEEEWIAYAKRYLEKNGSKIEDDAAIDLVKRIDGDYGRFLSELTKLDAFGSGATITKEDIRILVSPRLEEDAFVLSNALSNGNIEKALRVYRDLKAHSIDEIRLINMLGNQFRFLDEVAFLASQGGSKNAIASELNASPYRVDICLRNLRSMRPNATARVLERLYRCEKAILSGEQNAEFAFTRFLAETVL